MWYAQASENSAVSDKPIAYETYQALAENYAEHIDTKPHNAFYDRPATLSLLPDVDGLQVLDAGCGPGAYAQALQERGASVVACDISEKMLELARERLGDRVQYLRQDLTKKFESVADHSFDVVIAPLCLDYVENWLPTFREFFRILKPRGIFVFSCAHPSFDAEYFQTTHYFSVEYVECVWSGFGKRVLMPGFRRSWEELLTPMIEAGFVIERIHEPQPTLEFKKADPIRYEKLQHRPSFVCVRGRAGCTAD